MRGSSGVKRVGKYELGRTLGEGNFAKVKLGQDVESGRRVAIKVMDKDRILQHRMVDQIKREVSIMKMVRHPNIVQLIEVLASRNKIFMVLEFAAGGELFDRIVIALLVARSSPALSFPPPAISAPCAPSGGVSVVCARAQVYRGRLAESEARRYFQQLVDAVDCCHAKGVCHRDLKPENLLVDERGNLKVSDFGLSALPQQQHRDGLLHTTCGTPNYVAPEVLHNKGYDGRKADVWSCGVILFVLLAGYVPFDEPDLVLLYDKISRAHFKFPEWFSPGVKRLITRILNPDPTTRPGLEAIRRDEWFQRDYQRAYPLPDDTEGAGGAEDVLLHARVRGEGGKEGGMGGGEWQGERGAREGTGWKGAEGGWHGGGGGCADRKCAVCCAMPSPCPAPIPLAYSSSSVHPHSCPCPAALSCACELPPPNQLHPVAELSVRVPHSPSLQASLPVSLSPRTTAAAAPPAALGGREAQAGVAQEGRAGGAGEGGAGAGGAGAGAGEEGPEWVNAFDLIARAHALDLGALFHRRAHPVLRHTRFASRLPPALIRSRLLALAPALHAHAHANLFKVPCRGRGL
ncbi:unnamed protein product [Closterium sp. Naga37s-1]|nr:unnamed protein product [Closterium sp. Naga37s-1]